MMRIQLSENVEGEVIAQSAHGKSKVQPTKNPFESSVTLRLYFDKENAPSARQLWIMLREGVERGLEDAIPHALDQQWRITVTGWELAHDDGLPFSAVIFYTTMMP